MFCLCLKTVKQYINSTSLRHGTFACKHTSVSRHLRTIFCFWHSLYAHSHIVLNALKWIAHRSVTHHLSKCLFFQSTLFDTSVLFLVPSVIPIIQPVLKKNALEDNVVGFHKLNVDSIWCLIWFCMLLLLKLVIAEVKQHKTLKFLFNEEVCCFLFFQFILIK